MIEKTSAELEFTAVEWRLLDEFYPFYGHRFGPVMIQECRQRDGSTRYAIRSNSSRMSTSGKWSYEPMPSSRTNHYIKTHTFLTLQQATKAGAKAVKAILKEAAKLVAQMPAAASPNAAELADKVL